MVSSSAPPQQNLSIREEFVEGCGIALGDVSVQLPNQIKPQRFSVYAAHPADLAHLGKSVTPHGLAVAHFSDANILLREMPPLYGHAGMYLKSERDFWQKLNADDGYHGEWVVPPQRVILDYLYPSRNLLEEPSSPISPFAHKNEWVLSCTDSARIFDPLVFCLNFKDGEPGLAYKDRFRGTLCPVRFEPELN
ncbi:MAG: hypothetical protein H6863_02700 [Rhodospirillales bacterium]|nr:hypothetical protein [Rhodospirillales bacterium]MCB9980030.1 hypothetical protein [Rhodospirillales bacterium]